MTANDVRKFSLLGAQLAQSIGEMASIALALIAHCEDDEVARIALLKVAKVKDKMQADLDAFNASTAPTRELDS